MSGEALAKVLFMVSNISFVLAIICAVISVVFFIKFNIPTVIGDLSGKNARKSIEQMRSYNEKTGNKSFRPSKTNKNRVKLTSTMKGINLTDNVNNDCPETGLLDENIIQDIESEATTLLVDEEATGILQDETTLLDEVSQTMIKREGGVKLTIIDEVILIHTNEVIN
jgi:Sec-independent protein translocase protein TatA